MKKKRKTHSVDTMMRFFLQYYNIPTKQDIDKVLNRLDRLETAIKDAQKRDRKTEVRKSGQSGRRTGGGRQKMTATEQVVSIIKRFPKGIDVAGMKSKTGFEDKKIRNIVFRLAKQGTIKRIGRGVYAIS